MTDEPTGNLDANTARGIIDIFRRINEAGTSVIMVTHDEDLLFACTAVYRLEGGRLHLLTA